MRKELNRHFFKENIQTTNKNIEKMLNVSNYQENHKQPVKSIVKDIKITSVGKDVGKRNPCTLFSKKKGKRFLA